jgi:predicted metal-dependent phosphoesterase TrpH
VSVSGDLRFADLHLHTNFSDGTFSPAELVERAIHAKLSCIGVVDHDTVSGINPALEAAKDSDLEVVPGIELSAEHEGKEVHILGYLLDHNNKKLINELENLKARRLERVYKMVDKLNALGLRLKAESVFELAGNATVGRLHIARALVKEKLVGSLHEVFEKYLGDSGPAYVCGFRFNPKDAIKFIKSYGGIPVLAHPYVIDDDSLILEFIKLGLMGLEVYYPEHTQGLINFYLEMARQENLLVTGGSDCHGMAKPHVRIGCIKLPYELVEKLKEAKEKL